MEPHVINTESYELWFTLVVFSLGLGLGYLAKAKELVTQLRDYVRTKLSNLLD